MNKLEPIADKVGNLLRLLGSNHDGEALGAARAIPRVLKSVGLSLQDLSDSIGVNGKGVAEYQRGFRDGSVVEYQRGFNAGMQELNKQKAAAYQQGIQEGLRRTENVRKTNTQSPSQWHKIACACASRPDVFRGSVERRFIEGMVKRTGNGEELSEKQTDWLKDIFRRI